MDNLHTVRTNFHVHMLCFSNILVAHNYLLIGRQCVSSLNPCKQYGISRISWLVGFIFCTRMNCFHVAFMSTTRNVDIGGLPSPKDSSFATFPLGHNHTGHISASQKYENKGNSHGLHNLPLITSGWYVWLYYLNTSLGNTRYKGIAVQPAVVSDSHLTAGDATEITIDIILPIYRLNHPTNCKL